jgi:hypothetical protein
MGDRPNAKPLATNEDSEDEDLLADEYDTNVAPEAVNVSAEDTNQSPKTTASTSSGSNRSGSSQRRLTSATDHSTAPKKNSRGNTRKSSQVDDIISSYYLGENGNSDEDGDVSNTNFRQLRVREVEAREKEATARMMEAEAIKSKAATEAAILSVQHKANLLRERKKLLEEGFSQEEIDLHLPSTSFI